jgi:hypothetical protein
LIFSVRFIVNRIPRGHLKAFVAAKWPQTDPLDEQIVAELIVDGLLAQKWRIERGRPVPGRRRRRLGDQRRRGALAVEQGGLHAACGARVVVAAVGVLQSGPQADQPVALDRLPPACRPGEQAAELVAKMVGRGAAPARVIEHRRFLVWSEAAKPSQPCRAQAAAGSGRRGVLGGAGRWNLGSC